MVNSYLIKAFVCFDQNVNEYQILNEQYGLQCVLQCYWYDSLLVIKYFCTTTNV